MRNSKYDLRKYNREWEKRETKTSVRLREEVCNYDDMIWYDM